MDLIKTIEEQQKDETSLNFRVGDTVKVHFEIIEGKLYQERGRSQDFHSPQDFLRCWC